MAHMIEDVKLLRAKQYDKLKQKYTKGSAGTKFPCTLYSSQHIGCPELEYLLQILPDHLIKNRRKLDSCHYIINKNDENNGFLKDQERYGHFISDIPFWIKRNNELKEMVLRIAPTSIILREKVFSYLEARQYREYISYFKNISDHKSSDNRLDHKSSDHTLDHKSSDHRLDHKSSDHRLDHKSLDHRLDHKSSDHRSSHFVYVEVDGWLLDKIIKEILFSMSVVPYIDIFFSCNNIGYALEEYVIPLREYLSENKEEVNNVILIVFRLLKRLEPYRFLYNGNLDNIGVNSKKQIIFSDLSDASIQITDNIRLCPVYDLPDILPYFINSEADLLKYDKVLRKRGLPVNSIFNYYRFLFSIKNIYPELIEDFFLKLGLGIKENIYEFATNYF